MIAKKTHFEEKVYAYDLARQDLGEKILNALVAKKSLAALVEPDDNVEGFPVVDGILDRLEALVLSHLLTSYDEATAAAIEAAVVGACVEAMDENGSCTVAQLVGVMPEIVSLARDIGKLLQAKN